MELVLLDNNRLREQLGNNAADAADPTVVIAELLRAELAARTTCSRRALCERARQQLGPIKVVEVDVIREVLEVLEANGDVTSGPRGLVAAAPLRLVTLGAGRYLVRGTISNRRLREHSVFAEISDALSRTITVPVDREHAMLEAITALNGVTMDAQRWSGITRTSAADSDWLAMLDARLQFDGVSGDSLADEIVGKWQSYRPAPDLNSQQSRWQSGDAKGRLWRAKHTSRWRLYAWTGGDFPMGVSVIRLSEDEATRTMLSLDLVASSPLTLVVDAAPETPEVVFDGRFPLAEFRYLTTVGEFLGYREGQARYRIRNAVLGDALSLLTKRLGVVIASKEEKQ